MRQSELSREDLLAGLAALQAGDREKSDIFLATILPGLRRICSRMATGPADTDQLVSAVMAELIENPWKFDWNRTHEGTPETTTFFAFLKLQAKNQKKQLLRSEGRRARRQVEYSRITPQMVNERASDELEYHELWDKTVDIVKNAGTAAQSDNRLQVFERVVVDHEPTRNVAHRLGISEENVWTIAHRVRALLEKELESEHHIPPKRSR